MVGEKAVEVPPLHLKCGRVIPAPRLAEDHLPRAARRLVREERAVFLLEACGLDLLHEAELLEKGHVTGKERFADLEARLHVAVDEEDGTACPRERGRRRAPRGSR